MSQQLFIVEQQTYQEISRTTYLESSDWLFRNTCYNHCQKEWKAYQAFLWEQIDIVKSETLKTKLKQVAISLLDFK